MLAYSDTETIAEHDLVSASRNRTSAELALLNEVRLVADNADWLGRTRVNRLLTATNTIANNWLLDINSTATNRSAATTGVADPRSRWDGVEQLWRLITTAPRVVAYAKQYADRLSQLREAAVEDGYAMCTASANKFLSFLQAAPYDVRKAGLALAGDGDINAIWIGEDRKQRLSVQVFDDGDVEYVLLTPGQQPEMARVQPEEFWAKFSERLRTLLSA